MLLWLCLAGAGFGLLLLRFRGLPARTFAVLALALVVVDLLRAGHGLQPGDSRREHADAAGHGRAELVCSSAARRASPAVGDVPQNVIALRHRLPDARGNDQPILKRYNRLWRREVSPEFPVRPRTSDLHTASFLQLPRVDERRLRTLRLLGVTDLLVPAGVGRAAARSCGHRGLGQVYSGSDARVLRVDGALPRAFVAGAQQHVDGEDAALDAVTQPRARRAPRGRHRATAGRACRTPTSAAPPGRPASSRTSPTGWRSTRG